MIATTSHRAENPIRMQLTDGDSGIWTKAAAIASFAAAMAIPVGICSGTLIFLIAAGPVALVAGFGAGIEALSRRRFRDLIPAVFAILIGSLGTMFLVSGIIRWLYTGVFPTK
ncbi:MAG: hypothetical protein ACT4QC_02870 [Planctomycetaceae bacterium]